MKKSLEKNKDLIICSIIVGISSLLYINFSVENFKFSFAAVVFPLLLYIYDDLKPIAFGFASGISLIIFRGIFYFVFQGVMADDLFFTFPETAFYTVYGIMFYILKNSNFPRSYISIFIVSVAFDLISNIIETYIRIGNELFIIGNDIFKILLLVAIVRASLVFAMYVGYKYYKLFLIKEEHDKRYINLLELISQLKMETYFMEKNMDYIERVMGNAYNLYSDINEEENKENWSNDALEIAKDVHEIKKEYGLVLIGIEDILANKLDNTGMDFSELVEILEESVALTIKNSDKDISIKFNIGEDFYTDQHYLLMSVLGNLIMNAIEASRNKGTITVSHFLEGKRHKFIIEDDGDGIKKVDLDNIFLPGYSTKINYDTGEVSRGIGLSLVENVVKMNLRGNIDVESIYRVGTTFIVSIPSEELEDVER